MIKHLENKFISYHNKKIIKSDAQKIPIGNNILDIITANNLFLNIRNYRNVIKEIDRILKINGFFVIGGDKPIDDPVSCYFSDILNIKSKLTLMLSTQGVNRSVILKYIKKKYPHFKHLTPDSIYISYYVTTDYISRIKIYEEKSIPILKNLSFTTHKKLINKLYNHFSSVLYKEINIRYNYKIDILKKE